MAELRGVAVGCSNSIAVITNALSEQTHATNENWWKREQSRNAAEPPLMNERCYDLFYFLLLSWTVLLWLVHYEWMRNGNSRERKENSERERERERREKLGKGVVGYKWELFGVKWKWIFNAVPRGRVVSWRQLPLHPFTLSIGKDNATLASSVDLEDRLHSCHWLRLFFLLLNFPFINY